MPLSIAKFLVVDDHRLSRAIVVEALRAVGASRIRQAEDGREAMEMISADMPDIAVVDFKMPHDGLSLLQQIRRSPDSPDRTLPVIMLTAYTEVSRIAALRDAGANEVLTKPMSVKSLFRRVSSVIDSPRPFIVSENYVGPCRRRRVKPDYCGALRRASDHDQVCIDVA